MIFISYRQEDTKAEVTNLYSRLVERYGREQVFVDFRDIPPGEIWPDTLRRKLVDSSILLAVVGSKWGDARFPAGKKKGRLRLDDPEDWVRQEICTALARMPEMRVVVVAIDEAVLPETEWNCELDRLPSLERTRIRNQADFEHDFSELCDGLESQVPELRRAAEERRAAVSTSQPSAQALRQYLGAELRNQASIQLPLISPAGEPVSAPIHELRIDLPLLLSHEHTPLPPRRASVWVGREAHSIQEQIRSSHTSALLVDRASRFEDFQRDFDLGQNLGPGSRLVIVGDPGCGKSTLLQWIGHHYGSRFLAEPEEGREPGPQPLPAHRWLPILILCRDLAGQPSPARLEDLLRIHLKLRQFSDASVASLLPCFDQSLDRGNAILLVDGLDEIPDAEKRREFCALLTALARRFPDAPILVTSRVVGFQAVRDELASAYDHLVAGPLDRSAKRSFIERWSRLIGWDEESAASLMQQVCYSRTTAKLTDNVFLLAMVTQIRLLDQRLPGRRVDVYRRAVQLMIERRRPFAGPPLSLNEVLPHLEFLAYWMRKNGLQRCSETEAVAAFRELRRLEPEEPVLEARAPESLLQACIDSLGFLNVAGTEEDRRGFDRRILQFFHQSFQEYFAGQAVNHGHDAAGNGGAVARFRDLLAAVEIRERAVNLRDEYTIVEPVIADYWQEAVRLGIADLQADDADQAILMLLPHPATPPHEARPRAVFALQCLADEPRVSPQTALAVFDAALDNLGADDGFNTRLNTRMDEALAAVAESIFGIQLRARMLDGFMQSRDDSRYRIGACLSLLLPSTPITAENADSLIAAAARGFTSDRQAERVRTALELMGRFYATDGKLGFLTPGQRENLLDNLFSAFDQDEATRSAALWALSWLTGARIPRPENVAELVLLDAAQIEKIEHVLREPCQDANIFSWGCLLLTREAGLDLVGQQRDWIYELAVIADGARARHLLPVPRLPARRAAVAWIADLLSLDLSLANRARIAEALGAFGVRVPEMVRPLRFMLFNQRYVDDERSEALIYLALIGTREVVPILVEAADTPPAGKDEFLYTRGLFGLLLLDDVDVLAEQIRKALPHADLNAYAYGLAGSRDRRGRELLEPMKDHPDERIRAAAVKALARPWAAADR